MRHIEEIYLPLPAIDDEPNTEILEHQVLPAESFPDLVETEQGLMLRVSPSNITAGSHLSISFQQEGDSYQTVQLMPKYEEGTETIEGKEVRVFVAPLRFITSGDAELSVVVSASVRTETQINFYNFKLAYFSDRLEFEGTISGDEWVMVEGQTGNIYKTRVTGASGY
ncbi:hypothetical protein ES708_32910 [subsurface metagenome]